MGIDDLDEFLDEVKYQEEKRLNDRDIEASQQNKRRLLKDFGDNAEALAAYYEVDPTNIRIHDQLMDEQERALDLIYDCSAIPEYLREIFWEGLSDIDTSSRDADEYIRDFIKSLIEDIDTGNPESTPLLEALKNMYYYARLKK